MCLSSARNHDLDSFLVNWGLYEKMMDELDSVRPGSNSSKKGRSTAVAKKPETKLKIVEVEFKKDVQLHVCISFALSRL